MSIGILESARQIQPTGLLLDIYTDSCVAYSLRKLRTAYAGPCIKVRRSTDNTTLDIGFVGGIVDTTAITVFCIGADGFIDTWYNQGTAAVGNVSATAVSGAQPIIYSGGTIILQNGKPTITFDGISDVLSTGSHSFLQNVGFASGFSVYRFTNLQISSVNIILNVTTSASNSTRYRIAPVSTSGFYNIAARRNDADTLTSLTSIATTNLSNNVLHTGIINYSQAYAYQYINGQLDGFSSSFLTAGSTSNTASTNLSVGSGNGGANYARTYISEIILFNTDQKYGRQGIETNINKFYNIY
jgi:hypothetical protein